MATRSPPSPTLFYSPSGLALPDRLVLSPSRHPKDTHAVPNERVRYSFIWYNTLAAVQYRVYT